MKIKEYTVQFQHAETRSFDFGCSREVLAKNKSDAIETARQDVHAYFKKQKARVVDIRELDIDDEDDIQLLFNAECFDTNEISSCKKEFEILEFKFEKISNKSIKTEKERKIKEKNAIHKIKKQLDVLQKTKKLEVLFFDDNPWSSELSQTKFKQFAIDNGIFVDWSVVLFYSFFGLFKRIKKRNDYDRNYHYVYDNTKNKEY